MRDIKFRAWVKDHWIYKTHKKGVSAMIYGWQDMNCISSVGLNPDDIPIMQYTGLKDKSGVEIYEGDLVKFDDDVDVWVAAWSDSDASFYLKEPISGAETNCLNAELLIIGNIYENPELMEA